MNTPSNAIHDSGPGPNPVAPAVVSATRPFYWSIRRELWEYRSIYLAPLSIGGVIVLGFLVVLFRHVRTLGSVMALDPAHQREAIAQPFDVAVGLVMGAAFIVSIFYSLDALYGERRDRSILFWKSLPVSNLTTVFAKASITLVVLPVIAFAITVLTEFLMLLLSSAVFLASGFSVAELWRELALSQVMLMLLYHVVTVHILWYAPLYAWLLLISAWARRTPFLWATLPPLAIAIFEKIAFHTSHFADFISYRFSGSTEAVDTMKGSFPLDPAMHITPGRFLATPGLWLGLVAAVVFLLLAARQRRCRGPL